MAFSSQARLKIIVLECAEACNKNEQQQDAKNNAELQTKWTKTSRKIIEATIRRGYNWPIKT